MMKIWKFLLLEFCQKIGLPRFRVEVLSFYLTLNFSYVSYISPATHILSSIEPPPLLYRKFSRENWNNVGFGKWIWHRIRYQEVYCSRGWPRISCASYCRYLALFARTLAPFSAFLPPISALKWCAKHVAPFWISNGYNVSRFNNLNFAIHWKGGNSVVILEWISQYFMYLVNEALRHWRFLWPLQSENWNVTGLRSHKHDTKYDVLVIYVPSDLLIISWSTYRAHWGVL